MEKGKGITESEGNTREKEVRRAPKVNVEREVRGRTKTKERIS
jgi:hypothetical protein